jgi:glycosyltransferase involved in cell wall biosynthesis
MPVRAALMALNASGGSGVSRYTAALCRALDSVAGELSDLELEVVSTPGGAEALNLSTVAVREVSKLGADRAAPLRLIAEQVVAPRLDADLVHYFDVGGPLLRPGRPFVFTFHDGSAGHPGIGHFTRLQRARKLRQTRWSFARAAAAVAVSEFSKQEAVAGLGADPARVRVIYPGPGMVLAGPPAATPEERSRPYLLFVGNLTASKNVPFLVRAFHAADVPLDLVLAGRPLDDVGAIEEAIRSGPASERISVVPSPSDVQLDRLYRGATAFVFPSRYEGFGFPPLEAMARGCPVLAGDVPAVREVSGAGCLLLPLAGDAWIEAIRRVTNDSQLLEDLRRRGSEAVERYSWSKSARELASLFLELGAG